uniref:Uncharacterized protein n=1 Tax=Knipowitschia caucasica TaxID=637954 RepID=A0AAV2KKN8_KNICA
MSVCARRIVNGKSEEHFLGCISLESTCAEVIAKKAKEFMEVKGVDWRKMRGQGQDIPSTIDQHIRAHPPRNR